MSESETAVDADGRDGADAATDAGERSHEMPFGLPRWVVGVAPLLLLALLVAGVLAGPLLTGIAGHGEPLPQLSIDTVTVPDGETIRLHVTNSGPPVEVAQVLVDEAYWNFEMTSAGDDRRLETRESAVIELPYHWNPGFDYEIAVVLANGATFHHTVLAIQETPDLTGAVLRTLAIVGLLVGLVPVVLGMLWYPFMRSMRDRSLHAVLAFSAGILAFLAFDTGFEALEVAEEVPGVFEGPLLVVLGAVGALLVVQTVVDLFEEGGEEAAADGGEVSADGTGEDADDENGGTGGRPAPLAVAYAAALAIGLHNLAEGLAIGGAFALGRASLGGFLVVGFMVHNVTEGPVVVAPLAREDRPALWHFAALGVLAGAPVVLGGWIGNAFQSPVLGALFLAVGVGALVQVVWDVAAIVDREGQIGAWHNLAGFGVGLAVMYLTDLLVVL